MYDVLIHEAALRINFLWDNLEAEETGRNGQKKVLPTLHTNVYQCTRTQAAPQRVAMSTDPGIVPEESLKSNISENLKHQQEF